MGAAFALQRFAGAGAYVAAATGSSPVRRSAGVDAFAKQDGSFFLFFQGHPEYDADTLLREYRRDVARFLGGERDDYPAMPHGYFDAEAARAGRGFRERALAGRKPS